jgi:mannose-6-phosphate isomerase-like protein (cupin superfamily)
MIKKKTAEHYHWGNGCDGWHLLKHPELSVIQERMPPGTSEVRHYHERARQFFFVLTGSATIELNNRRETLHAHEGIEIPPGIPHQIFNESSDACEYGKAQTCVRIGEHADREEETN